MPVITASNVALPVAQASIANAVPIVIMSDGVPTTPASVAVVTQPAHGTAAVVGVGITYTPSPLYIGADSFTYTGTVSGVTSAAATVSVIVSVVYNCDCMDNDGNDTLGDLRGRLMARMGFGNQIANPPPGLLLKYNDFLQQAQRFLYMRYKALRTERFYSWTLQPGVRMYDIAGNVESCDKRLNPLKVTWVGTIRDTLWYPLKCGIPPELYSFNQTTNYPQRYEIRQCIEVWPTPIDALSTLVIKGHFGLEAFSADTDKTTIDSELVFTLALANVKADAGAPDASNYISQLQELLHDIVGGSHMTRRYIPGHDGRADGIYVIPRPEVPWT